MHLLYKGIHTGWSKKLYIFSTHHIFGTVQDKKKRISPKCSHSFSEQALGSSFMKWLNILSKLASVLLYPKTLLPTVQLMIIFAIAVLNITQS